MKKIIPILTLALILLSGTCIAEDAQSIMEKNDAIPEGESSKREMVLLIIKSGKNEKKEFISVLKRDGRKRRMRMQFTYPSQMGFLAWDEPGEDSQQWIKLTSGKVRKIASSDKDKPWMNSHFANDDIGETYIEDYSYTLIGEGDVRGISCYKIESKKVRGQKIYSKTVVYIAKDSYLTQRVEYYENGRHTKTLDLTEYEKIDGIDTPRKLIMERSDGKGKSLLYIKSIEYNLPVDDSELTREAF